MSSAPCWDSCCPAVWGLQKRTLYTDAGFVQTGRLFNCFVYFFAKIWKTSESCWVLSPGPDRLCVEDLLRIFVSVHRLGSCQWQSKSGFFPPFKPHRRHLCTGLMSTVLRPRIDLVTTCSTNLQICKDGHEKYWMCSLMPPPPVSLNKFLLLEHVNVSLSLRSQFWKRLSCNVRDIKVLFQCFV